MFWRRIWMRCALFTRRRWRMLYINLSLHKPVWRFQQRGHFFPSLYFFEPEYTDDKQMRGGCSMSEHRLLCQQHHTHASQYSREWSSKTDMEKTKWLNKVIICVFFAHKKYSRSFRKLWLNHWCPMGYFNNVLTTFWALNVSVALLSIWSVRKLSDFIKNIFICFLKMYKGMWNFLMWSIPFKLLFFTF